MESINQFLIWWSILSTVIALLLLGWDIWQFSAARKEEKQKKSQVKIWQQDANGISVGLKRIVIDADQGKYSSVKDVASAIWSLEASAFSLYQSLYEERLLTEEEYKQQQKELVEEYKRSREQVTSKAKKTSS